MFQRHTERARRTVHWARYIAFHVGSPSIEPEHLFLGILRQDMGLANRLFGSPWALEEVWAEMEKRNHFSERSTMSSDPQLSNATKGVMALAVEEADAVSDKNIGTSHLLLGLLREEKCVAAEILRDHDIHLDSTRDSLKLDPHDDSLTEKFVRKRDQLPRDVVAIQTRIRSIANELYEAIRNRDPARVRTCADEEHKERNNLYLLCQQHGLPDGLYE
jgi:ATP-dependent Clp protease ATP-binding subunit ClpC